MHTVQYYDCKLHSNFTAKDSGAPTFKCDSRIQNVDDYSWGISAKNCFKKCVNTWSYFN